MFLLIKVHIVINNGEINVNAIQDGRFRGCSQIWGAKKVPFPKICHTYPTMMKLGTVDNST